MIDKKTKLNKADCVTNAFFLILFLFFIFIPTILFSKTVVIDSQKQFYLAEKYLKQKDYDLSVSEYKKFIVFFPNDKKLEEAHYKVAFVYFKGGAYNRAIKEVEVALQKFPFGQFFFEMNLLLADCFNKLGNFSQVNIAMKNLLAVLEDKNRKDEALYKFAWFCFENGKWEKGKHYLSQISLENEEKYEIKTLNKRLMFLNKLDRKNPRVAGALSIIPGLGFAYCERYKDAFTSFLFNGLLIAAAKKSFDDDNVALGTFITIIELGFYTGNIYGSVSSAHKYNKKQDNRFFKILEDLKFSISSNMENSVSLSLNFPF